MHLIDSTILLHFFTPINTEFKLHFPVGSPFYVAVV